MIKYSVTSRVSAQYQEMADEIKVLSRDINSLPDTLAAYGNRQIVQIIDYDIPEDRLEKFKKNSVMAMDNLTLAIPDTTFVSLAEELNLPWFVSMPCNSWLEAHSLINLGASAITIGTPIFHNYQEMKDLKVPLRLTPNLSLQGENYSLDYCWRGQWILPQYQYMYEDLDITFEFFATTVSQQEAYFRIYKKERYWPGDMVYIVPDIDSNLPARMVPQQTAESRSYCNMRCMMGYSCRICDNTAQLMRTVINHKDDLTNS